MTTFSSSDEKITAALVHASIFLVFLGPVAPVLVWATQRNKSKTIRFHALQAMSYQVLMFWLWIVVMILIMVVAFLFLLPFTIFMMNDSSNDVFAPFIFQMFIFVAIFGSMGIFFLIGIIGAVYCLLGRDFRYPVIGKWLEKYLSYDPNADSPIDETREENLVAGLCHATAILRFWGIITPLVVWFTQKERSARLRFQSLQAAVYQGIVLLGYLVGMVLYMVSLFGFFFLLIVATTMNGNKEIQGPVAAIFLAFFGLMMLFWFVVMILMPIYYVLAAIGSIRVIRGHDFRYPILGRMLERRLERSQIAESTP